MRKKRVYSGTELLLPVLKVKEYIFKASAYGYHSGKYETNKVNQIMDEVALIPQERKTYFPEEDVDTHYADTVRAFYYALDETEIDYDALLIGSKRKPDVDAMWIRFVESIINFASKAGHKGTVGHVAYAAAKEAIRGMNA